jgi:lipid-binding SYLF domain-containing protein
MKRTLLPLLAFLLMFATLCSADEDRGKVVARIQGAGDVIDDIMATPDHGIPQEIMQSAECVAVVPSMLKGGFVFGGEYGRGVATCRTPSGWSAPAFFRLGGGSFGLQIGGQAVDLVMIIMNQRGMDALLADHVKLGADASAAAGPVGRHVEGMTDWKLKAEVLTYSRARGLFAGITLNGAVLKQDKGDTRSFYGHMIPFRRILKGEVEAPSDARPFLDMVAKYNAVAQGAPSVSQSPAPAAAPQKPAAPASTESAKPAATQTTTAPPAETAPASDNKSAEEQKPSPAVPQ